MKFRLDNLEVYFPYEYMYPEQFEYMYKLKQALGFAIREQLAHGGAVGGLDHLHRRARQPGLTQADADAGGDGLVGMQRLGAAAPAARRPTRRPSHVEPSRCAGTA